MWRQAEVFSRNCALIHGSSSVELSCPISRFVDPSRWFGLIKSIFFDNRSTPPWAWHRRLRPPPRTYTKQSCGRSWSSSTRRLIAPSIRSTTTSLITSCDVWRSGGHTRRSSAVVIATQHSSLAMLKVLIKNISYISVRKQNLSLTSFSTELRKLKHCKGKCF